MNIAIEDPAQTDIITLLEHGDAEAAKLYPAESNHLLPIDALREPNVLFHVARDTSGTALATGAVVLKGDWAEIKRMWVEPQARGQGLSRTILTTLEQQARAHGVRWLRLETGIDSHSALGLYTKAGFAAREPFADYRPDPLSVFMEKDLSVKTTA
ncbi:MAG: GNAT family N-acetyltransferase [Pseudomonadota bacterium]|jgi:putative acetyltransferase|uniref:GNAT family N-acetyltransferase n=1 Tax=Burkholderiaceae TaxID=119060 RepID=UPI0010F99E05|nr:GNAT family N-acetyltransferase [Burkholderia sp. 4M9327F10]